MVFVKINRAAKDGLILPENIKNKIFQMRGMRVMFDFDLAGLYGVKTAQLKRAVKRNISRFPEDFLIELTKKEFENLRCQFGTSSWGGQRYRSYAFTEQGVAMLSSVLNSDRAIQVNIQIMRAFTKLRELMGVHKDLREKIEAMEKKYDHQFQIVFEAIKKLLEPPEKSRGRIGF